MTSLATPVLVPRDNRDCKNMYFKRGGVKPRQLCLQDTAVSVAALLRCVLNGSHACCYRYCSLISIKYDALSIRVRYAFSSTRHPNGGRVEVQLHGATVTSFKTSQGKYNTPGVESFSSSAKSSSPGACFAIWHHI